MQKLSDQKVGCRCVEVGRAKETLTSITHEEKGDHGESGEHLPFARHGE